MTSLSLSTIEEALWSAAESVLGGEVIGDKRLVQAIIARSHLYTSERERIDEPPDALADVAARALFFTLADSGKVSLPLAELQLSGLIPQRVRLLDVGAGCGAMTWGVAAHGVAVDEVYAIDRDERALRIFAEAAKSVGLALTTRCDALDSLSLSGTFDLVVAGSVFNELEDPRRLVDRLLGCLSPSGALIISEPGSRDVARRLHELRDWVIDDGRATVFSPCVRRATPCPALAEPTDWCHEDRPARLPPRARALATRTKLRQHGMKFSYLVLRKDGRRLAQEVVSPARVVSRVRKLKGKWEGFLCSERGRERVSLLKRNRSGETEAFATASRGDVLRGVSGTRIERGDAVETVIAVRSAEDER